MPNLIAAELYDLTSDQGLSGVVEKFDSVVWKPGLQNNIYAILPCGTDSEYSTR